MSKNNNEKKPRKSLLKKVLLILFVLFVIGIFLDDESGVGIDNSYNNPINENLLFGTWISSNQSGSTQLAFRKPNTIVSKVTFPNMAPIFLGGTFNITGTNEITITFDDGDVTTQKVFISADGDKLKIKDQSETTFTTYQRI